MEREGTNSTFSLVNQQRQLLSALYGMQKRGVMCDMFVADQDGNSIEVHSCVLAAGCSILHNTLTLEQSRSLLRDNGLSLVIEGLSLQIWEKILQYLYTCEIDLTQLKLSFMQNLYEAARMLHLEAFENLIADYCQNEGIPIEETPVKAVNITLSPVVRQKSDVDDGDNDMDVKPEEGDEDVFSSADQDKPGFWSCHLCEHVFTNKRDLIIHRETACEKDDESEVDTTEQEECLMINNKLHYPADRPIAGQDARELNLVGSGDYICFNVNCSRSFASRRLYTQHLLECICSDDSTNITEHVRITEKGMVYDDGRTEEELPEDSIECPTASFTALDNKTLMNLAGPEKYMHFQCNHCPFRSNRVRMSQHLAVLHGRRQPYGCRICGQRYSYFDSVRDHYLSHHTHVSLICEDCDMVFNKKDSLRRHRLMVHKHKNGTPYICKGCGKGFKWPHHARRHERYHQRHNDRPYPCTTCPKSFATKQDLDRHLTVHFPTNSYSCDQCTYTTSRKFNLTVHERSKHNINRGSLLCITCNKCFVSDTRFQSHLKAHHHMGVVMNKDDSVTTMPMLNGDEPEEDTSAELQEQGEEEMGQMEEGAEASAVADLQQNNVQFIDFGDGMIQLVPIQTEGGHSYDITIDDAGETFQLNSGDRNSFIIPANTVEHKLQGVKLPGQTFDLPVPQGEGYEVLNKVEGGFEAMADGKTLVVYGIPTENE